MEDLRKQANDLLCYYGKMQNRLSQAGVNDTGSLVTMFNQLQRGLETVSLEELDPAIQEINRLVESLGKMQADLQVLKELKVRVGKMRAVLNGSSVSDDGNGRRAA
jgi:hypothetical protein